MGDTLTDLKKEWERSLDLVAETRESSNVIYRVLKDDDGKYHLHRYFNFTHSPDNWALSVDTRGTPDDVITELVQRLNEELTKSYGTVKA